MVKGCKRILGKYFVSFYPFSRCKESDHEQKVWTKVKWSEAQPTMKVQVLFICPSVRLFHGIQNRKQSQIDNRHLTIVYVGDELQNFSELKKVGNNEQTS